MSVEYSVLIVDPDTNTQIELNEILKTRFNIEEILTATDHKSAQTKLNDVDSIQCIIVNSNIDNGTGYEFISKIKQDEKLKNTTVLMLSDDNSRETLLQAAASGANELISKPISQRSVSLKLKRVFNVKEFRVDQRISTMGAIDVGIQFESGTYYPGKLIDISSGGCSIQSPQFIQGGCVYDIVSLSFEREDKSVTIPAELIRIEKDPESEDSEEKHLITAFQIKNLDDTQKLELDWLLSSLAKAKH